MCREAELLPLVAVTFHAALFAIVHARLSFVRRACQALDLLKTGLHVAHAERSIGHIDPGATSMAKLFESLEMALQP